MKFMKLALLGTAALAAVSVTARADELSDLKARIDALEAAQAFNAANLPAGYQLMTVGEAATIVVPGFELDTMHYGKTANNIGVLPTADMPASTNLQWSGFVRAALVYSDTDYSNLVGLAALSVDPDAMTHIKARGEFTVTGTTDTAVGEVGATMSVQSNWDGGAVDSFKMSNAWGWWKMTPELSFGGGYTGSLTDVGAGRGDFYAGGIDGGPGFGDAAQFRLAYSSGPIGLTLAVAHEDEKKNDDDFRAEASLSYTGDSFGLTVAGGVEDDNWQAVAKATATLDMISIGLVAGIGEENDTNPLGTAWVFGAAPTNHAHSDYWVVAAVAKASLSDSLSAELGASYKEMDGNVVNNADVILTPYKSDIMKVGGGLYYTPVSQLTLGVEGGWSSQDMSESTTPESGTEEILSAAFVSVFRF